MSRLVSFCVAAALLVCAAGAAVVQADHRAATLAVIMTNDPTTNQIKVYDVDTHVLLQTLSTHGKGGVGGNARGVKQFNGELFAAVNNGSNTVAIFKRDGNGLRFDKLVATTSAPVSVDFGQRSSVRRRRDDGRFVRPASEQRGMDGWHDGTRTGRRRRSARWQHGTSGRDQRATSARDPEDRSGSGHGRRRLVFTTAP